MLRVIMHLVPLAWIGSITVVGRTGAEEDGGDGVDLPEGEPLRLARLRVSRVVVHLVQVVVHELAADEHPRAVVLDLSPKGQVPGGWSALRDRLDDDGFVLAAFGVLHEGHVNIGLLDAAQAAVDGLRAALLQAPLGADESDELYDGGL